MNPLPHKYQKILVTIISLGILFLPAYLCFYKLSEIDFLCSTANWENDDDVDPSLGFDDKGKMSNVDVYSSLDAMD